MHYVAVVSVRSFKHGIPQRRYTGVKGLLDGDGKFDDLDDNVKAHLAHELKRKVPLHHMGRSIFHMHGSLFRAVCRIGLPRSGRQAIDVDVQCCYLSLRWHHFPDRDSCEVLGRLVQDPGAFYKTLLESTGLTRSEVK